ncbi:MAG: hypothetical protein QOJ07_538 [Thermoleophilaceae bacterium]|nr:hypothetical protein [Thermoleophilaceae bacterium]
MSTSVPIRRLASPWFAAAIVLEFALVGLDVVTGSAVVTTVFVLGPLALALVERPRPVAIVGILALALALASGVWDDFFLTVGHIIRCAVVALGGALAVISAQARTALAESRKEADDARREAESTGRRLDAMLGALAEAVTVHDEQGQTIYANEAARRLLGAESMEEVVSSPPGALAARFIVTREDGSPVRVDDYPGRRALAGPGAEPLLTRSVVRATGQVYWLLTKATTIREEDGSTLAVNVIEDVTEAKEAELRQRFLVSATQLLASSLDYDETLDRIAWLAIPTIADWCSVDVISGDNEFERVALAHHDPDKLALGRRLGEEYPPEVESDTGLWAVIRSGASEMYPDITDEMIVAGAQDERHLELVRLIGMRSAMMVPMRVGAVVLGALTFVNGDSGRTFDADDLAFAEELAARAGTAIQNARLYTQLTQTAHTLQHSLLPERLARPPGWRIAASYRAGERGSEVGGDFYDVFPVTGGWMIVLGDVTGKGVKAAALTALVRHTAKTAARFDPQPAAVMRLVNEVLREQPELSIVTVVCAVLRDSEYGAEVSVVSAGHPLPLRVDGVGGVYPMGRFDVVLGAVDEAEWEESRVTVAVGETLLFYTDGVTDMPGHSERFGESRLLAAAADGPNGASDLIARLDRSLDEFQTGHRADDRAMLALELVGVPREDVPAGASARSSF